MKTTKYKTKSLDEAAFLSLKGHIPEIKVIGDRVSLFTFNVNKRLPDHLQAFWTKSAQINLHSWLAVRQNIKHLCIAEDKAEDSIELGLDSGSAYWYIANGLVLHAIYGKNIIHKQRKLANNFYKTKVEAELALNGK